MHFIKFKHWIFSSLFFPYINLFMKTIGDWSVCLCSSKTKDCVGPRLVAPSASVPGKRGSQSPNPAVCRPPWPPWSPSCRCTHCPTSEGRSSPPAPPRGLHKGFGLRLAAAEDRRTQKDMKRCGERFLSTSKPQFYSLFCWSPWRECYIWQRHLPRGCSPGTPG